MSLEDLRKQKLTSDESPRANKFSSRSFAWLLPLALVAGFVGIVGLLFGERLIPAREVTVARVVTMRTAEADLEILNTGDLSDATSRGPLLFQASGWVEPDPYITYVPTLINGVIETVHVLEGETVRKGDLLATLVDDDAVLELRNAEEAIDELEHQITAHCVGFEIIDAEVAAAELSVEALRARMKEAEDLYNRFANLDSGAVARQQVIQAKLALEREAAMLAAEEAEIPQLEAKRNQLSAERSMMEAKVKILETAKAKSQLALDRTKIYSPMDGVVSHLHAAPGSKRMLNMDDPKSAVIVELYDPEKLQARIDVPLNEAAGLSVGQEVELSSDLLSDRVFTGRVTRVTGSADLQRNTLQAKVEIHDPDPRLRPDMLVRAKFFGLGGGAKQPGDRTSPAGRLSLYVPEVAFEGDETVWVVSSGKTAEKRRVNAGGDVRDGHRLVHSGVFSGESVILPPHEGLEEGERLRTVLTN